MQVKDKFGKVAEIGIFSTDVLTHGNTILLIPNSLVPDSLVPPSPDPGMLRLALALHLTYEESFPKVQKILFEVLETVPNILEEPLPEVGILSFDSHNVELSLRPYVRPDDFFGRLLLVPMLL